MDISYCLIRQNKLENNLNKSVDSKRNIIKVGVLKQTYWNKQNEKFNRSISL